MRRTIALTAILLLGSAQADEKSNEDRLRDALRQSVQEMRAAQDNAAGLQAQLTQAQQQLQALQPQLDAANARLAALAGKPQAKPEELQQLQAALAAAHAQSAGMQQGLEKWQTAYRDAADIARAKDAESRQAEAGLKANTAALETCKSTNKKLIAVAEDTLHLYETLSFRAILLKSYEPLIGTAKVALQNTVQDYDDRIRDEEYKGPVPGAPMLGAPVPGAAPAKPAGK